MASPELLGGHPSEVGQGTVNDPVNRTSDRSRLLALGEARWNETMGLGHVERLRHVRALLTAQGRDGAATAKLACYSGAGFARDLVELATRSDEVVLVGIDALYGRSG